MICLAMIETAEAVANLDEIVTTPGLDGVYIGPADLTLGLHGRRFPTGFDRQEPEMIAVIRRILDAAHRAGIKAGLHCGTPDYAAQAIGWGFDLVTLSERCPAARRRRRRQRDRDVRQPAGRGRCTRPAKPSRAIEMPHVLVAGRIHEAASRCLRGAGFGVRAIDAESRPRATRPSWAKPMPC